MPAPFDIARRDRRPELMDDPALDEQRHERALHGLTRINRFSGSVRTIWQPIRALARRNGAQPLRILDIATGAGDLPVGLWRCARRTGLPLTIDACDVSPRALTYARLAAARAGAEIRFFEFDAFSGEIPPGYHVMVSSLFLHHLDDDQARHFLRRMTDAARRMVLVNDLRRCRRGLLLAYVAPRALCRSAVVHHDAVLSVRAAYTLAEVRALAQSAGLDGVHVAPRWPCRFLLTWTRR